MGSFVNALVWRLHEQSEQRKLPKPDKKYISRLSVIKGASMCPECHHPLAAKDLIPVLSWLTLKGKCRYCGKPISAQYPVVELATALLFLVSYIWWPGEFTTAQTVIFVLWLALLTGLMALLVYDARWFLLPDRLVYPLTVIASALAVVRILSADKPVQALVGTLAAVIIGGGIFYVLFQLSDGKWIGGGDVKLGWLLGLIVGTPGRAVLFIFCGALLGSLVSVPLLASGKLKRHSLIPFGPFLIAGAIIAMLFGGDILHWYRDTFIYY